MSNYSDLEEKGYLIIRNFASEEEIHELIRIYNKIGNKDWKYPICETMNYPDLSFYKDKCLKICSEISTQTDINCDVFSELSWFARLNGEHSVTNWQWHQDVIGYYISPNVYDYLNFFMPIIKTDEASNNLALVPMDALKQGHNAVYQKLKGKGYPSYKLGNDQIFTGNSDDRVVATLPNIDELSVTPTLGAGDLLIIRGDVIHKTQNVETDRVAISYRFRNSSHIIKRNDLMSGGLLKLLFMYNYMNEYYEALSAFRITKVDEMSIGSLLGFLENNRDKLEEYSSNTDDDFFKLLFFNRTQEQIKNMFREINKRVKWGLFDDRELHYSEILKERLDLYLSGKIEKTEFEQYKNTPFFADAV